MKHKIHLSTFLWPWLMSFLISCGAVGCLITAFDLPGLSAGQLILFSLVLSGVFSLAMAYRPRWWIPILLAAGFFFLLPTLADAKKSCKLWLHICRESRVRACLYSASLRTITV